ncbi:MAG: hypothetical protein HC844_16600 [Tabrizicola sp.]|nr:hypothetical protein [Tabrizicola sp.]
MTVLYTETEVISRVPGLTAGRLAAFVTAELVDPHRRAEGLGFDPIALARLALLMDLTLHFDLEGDALAIVLSLIDELHAAHGDMAALAEALSAEPEDVRRRVATTLLARQRPPGMSP